MQPRSLSFRAALRLTLSSGRSALALDRALPMVQCLVCLSGWQGFSSLFSGLSCENLTRQPGKVSHTFLLCRVNLIK